MDVKNWSLEISGEVKCPWRQAREGLPIDVHTMTTETTDDIALLTSVKHALELRCISFAAEVVHFTVPPPCIARYVFKPPASHRAVGTADTYKLMAREVQ